MKPFETVDRIRHRMAEAMIAQSGIRHPGLAAHLRHCLVQDDPVAEPGTLLRKPVVEGAFPFAPDDRTLGDLEGSLLDPRTVAALDGAAGDLRFPRDRHPYMHQVAAWERLSPVGEPKSAVVTSGTGSGKTECFLVPMLDDMIRRGSAGQGVEAIMLYPLNALIESQRERLDAWTAPMEGAVRYALYNGLLDERIPAAQRRAALAASPQEVPDRMDLRANPPQILVTNITMLEYMLIRAQDAPILDRSRGSLRWIVLDEAHTLVGAAAAEIALLLRRVMLAFKTDPAQVRFVATSATIGEGEETKERLRRFLADVGGIADAQVEVIEGHRILPDRPGAAARPEGAEIAALEPDALYDRLGAQDDVWSLVEELWRGTVAPARIAQVAAGYGCGLEDFTMALSRARSTAGQTLAPLRVHAMQRATAGLWSCLNSDCAGPDCAGSPDGWDWGRILHERAEVCDCGSAVAEIRSCNDCGTVTLHAVERDGALSPPMNAAPGDEFALDALRDAEDAAEEDGEEAPETAASTVWDRCFAAVPRADGVRLFLERGGTALCDTADRGVVLSSLGDGRGSCPDCGSGKAGRDKLFPFRFGAPFAVTNATPILIEGMPGLKGAGAHPDATPPKPAWGRQIISFTDSRQGTARMAATLQLDSERNFTRSVLYRIVQDSLAAPDGGAGDVTARIEKLRAAQEASGVDLSDNIAELEARLTPAASVPWAEARDSLAAREEVAEWMKAVWGERDDVFAEADPATQIARMQMLRELARRPKTANSMETMGLLRFEAPALRGRAVPGALRERGFGEADWYAFLMFLVTFHLRANGVVRVPAALENWATRNMFIKKLLPANGDWLPGGYFWPRAGSPNRARAVAMLEMALQRDATDAMDAVEIDDVLTSARDALRPVLKKEAGTEQLDFEKLHVAPMTDAFICPVTNRFIDVAPFGLSPHATDPAHKAEPVTMPRPPDGADDAARRAWLAQDETVTMLRGRGHWGALHDRIVLFADYIRSAEHSAQLPRARLKTYEDGFKAQEINVLNCSTTMEMGVDIGSVNGVMMTNVPPSIANYRQRIGRAGRRGQALSMGFTIAKDRPLDREAFTDIDAYLKRSVAAPRVALDSATLVQRHVNAYLLGRFLREREASMQVTVAAFFGYPAGLEEKRPPKSERAVAHFVEWLRTEEMAEGARKAVARIVRGSVLEDKAGLVTACAGAVEAIAGALAIEYGGIRDQAKGADPAARGALDAQARRLTGEFLLKTLCNRAFLPGHNFPTSVVSLIGTDTTGGRVREREDNRRRAREAPSRSLDVALREYAPGAEVVIDGQVYRCGGVTLNWKRPASEDEVRDTQDLGWAGRCGACGEVWTGRGNHDPSCPACGEAAEDIRAFLVPAGFRRDMATRPHAEVDSTLFVPLDPARVSAGDGSWRRLPGVTAFRHRTDAEGSVFFRNRGPGGHGYGLCLHCGRMEPMDGTGEVCTALLDGHVPLTSRGYGDRCEGPQTPFRIRHGVDLAHEMGTDVFELQPAACPDPAAGVAIAVAMREALAALLGVEADDIGFAVRPGRNALGARTMMLALFDRPAGGLGYATRAASDLRAVLEGARRVLDCRNARCGHACSACVLTGDAPGSAEEIDRRAALAFFDAHLAVPRGIAEADAFAPGAELSDAVLDHVDGRLRAAAGATVRLWVADADPGALEAWEAARYVRRWTDDGHAVRVVFEPGAPEGWNDAGRLSMRDFASRNGCTLATGEPPRFDNGAVTLARIEGTGATWATRDAGALSPEGWARGAATVAMARLPDAPEPRDADVPPGMLISSPGASVVPLSTRYAGEIGAFGAKMGARIARALAETGHGDTVWTGAVYSDRYLRSPLTLRLLLDTLGAVLGAGARVSVTASIEPDGPPRAPFHDIGDAEEMRGLVAEYGARQGLDATFVAKDARQLTHARSLTLTGEGGAVAQVLFDQGFGWLTYAGGRSRLDWRGDDADRAASLGALDGRLTARISYLVALPPEGG